MEAKLNANDRLRISTDQGNTFIDVECCEFENGLKVSHLVFRQYFEVREKNGQICSFYFLSKRYKKDYDFGYWNDAEVIFSNNQVNHK